MEYIKLTDEELIQYCKNNNIEYLKKNKKVYTKKTLIRNIMKSKKSDIKEPKNAIIEEMKEPKYINEIVWTLEQKQDPNENYKQIKDDLNRIIKKCHDLLYSSHAIVGMKAQNDIMRILTVIILKPQFMDENSEIMQRCNKLLEDGKIKIKKDKFEKYILYCKDIKELANTDNPLNEWKMFVNTFLSKILPFIYNDDDTKFNFNDENIFRNIIVELSKINVNDDFIDAFSTSYGDIHEAFRVYSGGKGAKELGQFFTPRNMIHAIFNGCGLNDVIKSYNNPNIYDPCMGTAGLLTRAYSNGNILPNNIYGCETEKDTIKFAECGILLTTKQFNSNLIKCDSLCNNPYIFERKFEIIFTNPPFGTKMNYKDLKIRFNEYKEKNYNDSKITFEDIYPYESNNGACLFIQLCMFMLSDKGTCTIILPDGELMTSNRFMKFRKMMCDNVNIIKIIKVEGGAFEHTGIKTNTIIFNKNEKTKNIEFMEINKECNSVKLNAIMQLDNKYNFTFIEKKVEKVYDLNVEIKKIGDLFNFNIGNIQATKCDESNIYPVISSSDIHTHSIYELDGENLFILKIFDGASDKKYTTKIKYYNGKCNFTSLLYNLKAKCDINIKYIYYYLNNNVDYISKTYQKGSCNKSLDLDLFKEYEIPVPSLENQEIIVSKLDKINNNIETIKTRITQLKEEGLLFMETYNINTEIKKIGDVCEFIKGKRRNANEKILNGEYEFITCSIYGKNYINEYDFNDEALIINSINGSGKCMIYIAEKYCTTNNNIHFKTNKLNVKNKYIYYYLYNNLNILEKGFEGSNQKKISIEYLENIEIPFPSLETQEKLVSILDNIYKKIDDENKHIELLKQLSKDIIVIN